MKFAGSNQSCIRREDGTRQEIAAHYVIKHKNRVGFEIADYDLRRPLFIDPLVYSTYLGGSGHDDGLRHRRGQLWQCLRHRRNHLNRLSDDESLAASVMVAAADAFVAKLNPSGSALVYSTYLGGSGHDDGYGIAVDSSGNAYVAGYTASTNFPTMNPTAASYGGGTYDAFVAELNPTGSALVYSTYLGGSEDDYGYGIAVDSSGNAYVTGSTGSTNFPTMNPLQPTYGGGGDAFVSELNPSGSALVYSTYLKVVKGT